tara:strand:- start:697 stop:1425 length:729 start_codon:yes stop_codon:yes gene_type:complete
MPLKNGELSGPEIRKLIRGHNKLAQIKVPTGLDRDGLIKFLKSKKYTVDHEKKMLVDNISGGSSRGRRITLAKAKDITKPQPKSDAQKAATKAKKDEKAKVMKSKEDAIKAEGVKQGAALQRVVSKRTKAKAKPAPAPTKQEIQTVFSDIMTGYTEIVEDGASGYDSDDDDDKAELKEKRKVIKTSKNILSGVEKGKTTFTPAQKVVITLAIKAYIDLIQGDSDAEKELSIAKELLKKYKKS